MTYSIMCGRVLLNRENVSPQMHNVYIFTIQKYPPTHNRIGHSAILLTHASLSPKQGNLPPSRSDQPPPPLGTTKHFQGEGQRTSLRTTTTPHLPRITPPPNIVIDWFIFMYFVLLSVSDCFIEFYQTPVLIQFVKLCVCRDLYTTHARACM